MLEQSSQIIHIPAVQTLEEGWAPFRVGGLDAGEALSLPFGAEKSRIVFGPASVWRHAGGELPYFRPASSEFMMLLGGRVRIEGEGFDAVEAKAGDAVIVPQGFVGTWTTLEPVYKVSSSFAAADAADEGS
jgi:hypothetical protein